MINIDELRQRVEAAEQRFGMIDSSQRRSSEKLIGMMSAIEQDQAQKQVQLDESKVLIASMTNENQQLRSMLHSLLLAIEAAGSDQSVEIMREMDSKLSALVEEDEAAVEAPEPVAGAESVEPEPVVVEVPEPEAVAPEALDLDSAAPEVSAAEIDEPEAGEPETGDPEIVEPELVEPEIVEAIEAEVEMPEPVLGTAPAETPIEDDVLPEPPGVLPSAVAEVVIEDVPEEAAPAAEVSDGGVSTGEAKLGEKVSNMDAAEAADGVREILERMNREKKQKEAAAQS